VQYFQYHRVSRRSVRPLRAGLSPQVYESRLLCYPTFTKSAPTKREAIAGKGQEAESVESARQKKNRLDVTVTTCHPIHCRKRVNSSKLLSLLGFFCPPKKKLPRHPHQVYKQQLQARHHRPASNSGAGAGLPFPSRSRSFISCLTCLTWLP
jgi:hypothetical protein